MGREGCRLREGGWLTGAGDAAGIVRVTVPIPVVPYLCCTRVRRADDASERLGGGSR
jgi:hypothetical protein